MVISEVLRLVTAPASFRMCTKDWPLPDTDVVIPKGMRVVIPIIGLHFDERFWSNPTEFDPDRWSAERRGELVSAAYMPFGYGPRQCLGMKMARMEMKVLVFQLLRHFRLERCEKTVYPMKFSTDFTHVIDGGVWLRIVERS